MTKIATNGVGGVLLIIGSLIFGGSVSIIAVSPGAANQVGVIGLALLAVGYGIIQLPERKEMQFVVPLMCAFLVFFLWSFHAPLSPTWWVRFIWTAWVPIG